MLSIQDLCLSYGDTQVLSGVNISVDKGELFALLGPSGSGKSTVLRSVAGLESPNQGEITVGGRVVYSSGQGVNLPAEQRRLGMVFQSYALWPHLTVRQNIELPLRTGEQKIQAAEMRTRVEEVLHLVELENLVDRPVPRLSGGQQQRVALARALATRPELMLMDEPLCNLDARLRETIRENIKKIVKQAGITVLYVTHDQVEAMAIADRMAVMAQGQVRQVGSPRELYRQPEHPRIADFLGDVNWIPGEINETGLHVAFGKLEGPVNRQLGPVTVGLRPESLKLYKDGHPGALEFLCDIESVSYLGESQLVRLSVKGVPLIAKVSGNKEIGRSMWLQLVPSNFLVFPGHIDAQQSAWPDN